MTSSFATRAVGGIRLADKPFHLGHYVGTFAAHAAHGESNTLVYIIKDTEPYRWASLSEKTRCIGQLAKAAMAAASPGNVLVVLTSTLARRAWTLQCVLADCIGYRSLVSCHFQKEAIRSGDYEGRVKNFLFPFEEAVILTFLQAEHFYSNLDNQRIIRYVRDCQERLDNGLSKGERIRTQIRNYPDLPFLPGDNYKRMASNSGNVVSISADDVSIIEFCRNAVKLGRYFNYKPASLTQWDDTGELRLDDDYLPAVILKVLGCPERFEPHRVQTKGKETVKALESELRHVLMAKIAVWRDYLRSNASPDREIVDGVIANGERLAVSCEQYWNDVF